MRDDVTLTPVELDEYQRDTSHSLMRRRNESIAGWLSSLVALVSRAMRLVLGIAVGSLAAAGAQRWAVAVALGLIVASCEIVAERGVFAQSLVMSTLMIGRPGLTVAVVIGCSGAFVVAGTALQEIPGLLAYTALLQVILRPLVRIARRTRSQRDSLISFAAFVAAFGVRIVPGLIAGDGITALPVACAVSGLVVAFGYLCGRALLLLSSVLDGDDGLSSLSSSRRSETKYVLVLLMIVIGGLDGIAVGCVSPGHMLASTAVLATALGYGSAAGAFMGCIAGLGLVLADTGHLPMIAVYSVSGVVAGLLRGHGTIAPLALGTIAGSTICLLLCETVEASARVCLVYLAAGGGLAYLIHAWFPDLFVHVPVNAMDEASSGSSQAQVDGTRKRLRSLVGVFELLAQTLSEAGEKKHTHLDDSFDILLQELHTRLCDNCGRHDVCWNGRFYASYETFLTLFAEIEMESASGSGRGYVHWEDDRLPVYLRQNCVNSHRIVPIAVEILEEKREELLAHEQMAGVKEVVSSQFKGIAEIVDRLVEEVCEREQACAQGQNTGEFRSRARPVEVGIYCAARSGNTVSGDSRLVYELGQGRTLIVLGDGMGSGESAASESRFATTMLKELMAAGVSQRSAVEVVNSMMLIRRKDESFSTLDIAIVDTVRRQVEFTKMGSCPSYIKSGRRVRRVSSPSLPIGILPGLDFDTVSCPVNQGDMVLMVSDGVLGFEDDMDVVDEWIMKYLECTKISCPRALVNSLADEMRTTFNARWDDDVTLIAVKLP